MDTAEVMVTVGGIAAILGVLAFFFTGEKR